MWVALYFVRSPLTDDNGTYRQTEENTYSTVTAVTQTNVRI